MIILALLSLLAFAGVGADYVLQSNFSGATFFDNFNFYSGWDPTYGFAHYVDRGYAQSMGMINYSDTGPATFGVDHVGLYDPNANLGRASIRLESLQQWTHGLFIVDLAHMPGTACGTWPAMWILGGGPEPWPANGEIDIIEFPNLAPDNLMALHTLNGCTIAGTGQSGTLQTNDCGFAGGFLGCSTSPNKSNTAGTDFNAAGGGVYAMEWSSTAIRVWNFPRGNIPPAVTSPNPDPTKFGIPDANFEGDCDIDTYFRNGTMIFNIEFCGGWAGPTFHQDGCPALNVSNAWSSCNMYVAANPQAYDETYWAVNYVHVYTTTPGTPPPASSVLSSVLPVASTSSATIAPAEGQSTTHSTSLWPPTTVSTLSLTVSSATSSMTPSTTTSTSSTSTTSAPPPPPPPASTSTSTTSSSVPTPSSPTPPAAPPSPAPSDPGDAATTQTVFVTHTVTVPSAGLAKLQSQTMLNARGSP